VKNKHWTTFIAGIALVLGICALPGITQQQPAAQQSEPIPYLVAVVDVAQVLNAHPDYIREQENLKRQATEAEATFEKRREAIANKKKNLDASPYKSGSPEHQRILDEIANDVADYEKDMKAQQRKFILANSQIVYNTYKNIKDTIGRIAKSAGIAQVTDYREFEPNPAEPQSVIEDMDQRLVWFNSRLNITESVIQQLYKDRNLQVPASITSANAGAGAANPASPAPAAARTAAAPAGMQQRQ